jgi:hypothetical protein
MATAPKKPRAKKAPATTETVSIKGFDQNWQCRGYQFAIGKTYEHEGRVRACEGGFHACTTEAHPFEVFSYYSPAGSRFAMVRQSGDTHSDDKIKIASAKITIDCEITIGDLVKRAWDYVWSRATKSEDAHVAVDYGAASSTGYHGAASSTGDYGAASSTGYQGAASSTGTRGAASSTGYQGAASSTGTRGAASSTGYQGAASSTGTRGAASSTGDDGAAMASGYAGKVMGADGNALFAVERDDDYKIVSVAAGIVGQDDLNANVWYSCQGGKLVECGA